MTKQKSYLKNRYHQAKKYFFARQPQFLFLSVLLVMLFFLEQTAYFTNILNVQRITFILWPIAILALNLKSKASFVAALIFLLSCPLLIILVTSEWEPERFANYAYFFLLVGIIQEAVESFKK